MLLIFTLSFLFTKFKIFLQTIIIVIIEIINRNINNATLKNFIKNKILNLIFNCKFCNFHKQKLKKTCVTNQKNIISIKDFGNIKILFIL